jgi:hypothetical protein
VSYLQAREIHSQASTSDSSSEKLTPGRTGKGGHREYTLAFPLDEHEDRVFPINLGAAYLKKKKNMSYEKNISEATSKQKLENRQWTLSVKIRRRCQNQVSV